MAAESIAGLLRAQADTRPDATAYGFLRYEGDTEIVETMTYAELDAAARRIASLIADRVAPGGRVLLAHPPGRQFIEAFFGSQYAGAIAVPVYPPVPPQGAARLAHVAADAGVELALTTAGLEALGGDEFPWLASDTGGDASAWRAQPDDPEGVAMIQYTSGSTAAPRGVVMRHRHLLASISHLRRATRTAEHTVGVNWAPTYHDMGLIGCILMLMSAGRPTYVMSPLDFLERPVRWLEAISRLRATLSVAPPFGYSLCTRRVPDEALARLDLSSWLCTVLAADVIPPADIRAFCERFAVCGFDANAIQPAYGLAEATLQVTIARPGEGMRALRADPDALARGTAAAPGDAGAAVEIACLGGVQEGLEVAIVDRESAARLPDGEVGEIWVRGDTVTDGYWRRPPSGEDPFDATLAGEGGGWLRTGDLGFVVAGELYVTGRVKEVMILRGRNVYPHDVERAVQDADPRLRRGCGAAFALGDDVVLVQETAAAGDEAGELVAVARRAAAGAGVPLARLVLVPPRSLPKTSSGKLMRTACRERHVAGELDAVADWGAAVSA